MPIELFWFNLFSLLAGFFFTLLLIRKKAKSLLLLAALAVVLFVLFGIFSIPGFLLGLGVKALFSDPKSEAKAFKKRSK